MGNSIRIEKLIHDSFDFLITEYQMTFRRNCYPDYLGFAGPVYAFSYFNQNGCFSFHYIVQKDELGLFTSHAYADEQEALLQQEISTVSLGVSQVFTKRQFLFALAKIIREEINMNGTVLGIPVHVYC